MNRREKKARAMARNAERAGRNSLSAQAEREKMLQEAERVLFSALKGAKDRKEELLLAEKTKYETQYLVSVSYSGGAGREKFSRARECVFSFVCAKFADGQPIAYCYADEDGDMVTVSSPLYNAWASSLSPVPYMGFGE